MNLHKQFLTNNNCYKKNEALNIKGVMWHSTAANNPNLRRYVQPDDGLLGRNTAGNHWNVAKPDGQSKCVHAFIGKLKDGSVATYQTLPWNTKGWHCGGTANSTHIGFEICEAALSDKTYFNAVYKEACELTAYLCDMFNLDPMEDGVIICHSEGYKRGVASNHADVMHWFSKHGKTMDDVRKDVKALLSNAAATPVADTQKIYKVQTITSYSDKTKAASVVTKMKAANFTAATVKVGSAYKVQCGAYKVYKNAQAQVSKLEAAGFKCAIY